MNYSVLMSVYAKEKPEYLRESMESIYNQSVPCNDFVLVCDGSLNEGLDNVISEMQSRFGDVLNVVRLETNGGLGKALNIGIKHCKNEFVARMDSDDISRPDRCELQLKAFSEHTGVVIVSGIVEEFGKTKDIIEAKRVLPEKNEQIVEFAKKRNPYNHPCVMYKKSSVEEAGGYQDFYLLEDYFLWLRMIFKGSKGYNIQKPLLWMRAGNGMYKRRSGLKYIESQKRLFKYMYDNQFISKKQYFISSLSRTVSSIVPNRMRRMLYFVFLRN